MLIIICVLFEMCKRLKVKLVSSDQIFRYIAYCFILFLDC